MKTITITLASPVKEQRPSQGYGRKNVAAASVLEDETVETVLERELKSYDEYFMSERIAEIREHLSLSDQTLIDGKPSELAAFEDADVAQAIVNAQLSEYKMLTQESQVSEPWEYRWDHGSDV